MVFPLIIACKYIDAYGRELKCVNINVGPIRFPIEPISMEIENLPASSWEFHAFSYYYLSIALKKKDVLLVIRYGIYTSLSVGWEMFETYVWRTTPISVVDIAANTLGFLWGEIFGENPEMVVGIHPIRDYPKWWYKRPWVNDGNIYYMLFTRFDTNYAPKTFYIKYDIRDFSIRLGFNVGRNLLGYKGDNYIYRVPYDTSGVPALFLSANHPKIYMQKVPFSLIDTGEYSYWVWDVFLDIKILTF